MDAWALKFGEKPEPGDLIEIFHIGYKDWAIYVGDGYVIHLAPPTEFPRFGSSKMFMFLSRKAVVANDPLEDVAWGCLYRVNNHLDHQYRPRPVDEIIGSAKKMIGDKKTYKVLFENREDFVTDLRYGWPRCKLVRPPLV
ncbi:phospholipase A and acyltransferase 4-like [Dugong dugon]